MPESLADEVLDTSFECHEQDGLFLHPLDCKKFVNCTKGVPTLQSCPPKRHFNNETKKCESPCKAYCDRTYGKYHHFIYLFSVAY